MSAPESIYRPCVGIMLVNAQNRIFVGRRANKKLREHYAPGFEWQMPQGGIDPGESPYQAALRELREETNVASVSLIATSKVWRSYDLPADVALESFQGRYRGQRQKWFALRFEGQDEEINVLNPGPGFKAEFDAWRWEKIDLLPSLVIPFKRAVYEKVVAEFAGLISPS